MTARPPARFCHYKSMDAHQPIYDENGRKVANVTNDGHRVMLVMFAPDGYSGRSASWLLTPATVRHLADAAKAQADLIDERRAIAAGANTQMGT